MRKAMLRVTKDKASGNLVYTIRAGAKGKGKRLWRCISWDNPKATDEADKLAYDWAIENNIELTYG